jgi:hypothetical protein
MARVIGFVLLAVLLVAIVWFLLKKKKQKSDCEKLASGAVAAGEAYTGDKLTDDKATTDSLVSVGCSALEAVAEVGGKVVVGGSTLAAQGVSALTGGGCEGCPPVTSAIKILGMKCADLRKYCKAAPAGGLPSAAFCKVANDRKCPP